nr:hypothetical protein [Tanacetum cinerariifolium]
YHLIFDLTKNLWKTRIDKKLPPGLTVYMQNWSKASDIASGRDIRDNGYEPPDELDYNDICQAASMVESKLGAQRVLAFSHRETTAARGHPEVTNQTKFKTDIGQEVYGVKDLLSSCLFRT